MLTLPFLVLDFARIIKSSECLVISTANAPVLAWFLFVDMDALVDRPQINLRLA